MTKFAIGGQLNKAEIKEIIEREGGPNMSADIFSDTEAALKVKTGEYDYYVGACQSGAGGALGMAYGLLGMNKCATIAMAGRAPKEERVKEVIGKGAKAFGFTGDQVEASVSMIVKLLKEK
ncbi:DUF2620 domain-containing protein [Bacillus sp. V33-4]|uniref:DUF2620 domain-containing protein n=1 Tax=Bacillus sp. V33-4 TaxID=2054169 RepID=UPI000C76A35A|nr:DUF2620 domain-containing protein [Bacillus sp. V33-4]PLR80612.1 DUF2620 domain-containing protein [Bacillus sp. V33-4]